MYEEKAVVVISTLANNTMTVYFYKFPVTTQIFHVSKHSFALVNLKPIVPGHTLVVPFRKVSTLDELPDNESTDFFQTVKRIQRFIRFVYKCDAINLGIQDGVAAGQSVPHLHCHLIPRYLKDGWGDGIYNALEVNEGMMKQNWWKEVCEPMGIVEDEDRKVRTMQEMEQETKWLMKEMKGWLESNGEWKNEYDVGKRALLLDDSN